MTHPLTLWIGFNIFVLAMLSLDLAMHRNSKEIQIKEALGWSFFWIALALVFNVGIYYYLGSEAALSFLTGYLLEKSLSIDNLFVFLLIFNYFHVPKEHIHRVLMWGILGALVMRGLFIAGGLYLISHFHWILYFFGAFLIYGGIKLAQQKDVTITPDANPVLQFAKKHLRLTKDYVGKKFFVKHEGKYFATPLFMVLLFVETTDLIFALDSIPAIMAITLDPFIVYTSNVFALLGLRALFFALSGLLVLFHHLHYGLAFILVFIGVKLLISSYYAIPIVVTLSVVVLTLILSVVASIIFPKLPKIK